MQNAVENFAALRGNSYPGRGLVVGKTPNGNNLVQMAWLMGRSENSRNRRYVHEGNIIRTEAVDPSKVTDPSLIIYNAMREDMDHYAVTNGDQTDTIFESALRGGPDFFVRAMCAREYEPDAPNFTPRISALCGRYRSGLVVTQRAILSRSPFGTCDRAFYRYSELPKGYGYCVHTYTSDDNPLPSFLDTPRLVPMLNSIVGVSNYYWGTLNSDNRVALVTKFVAIGTGESKVHIINRH